MLSRDRLKQLELNGPLLTDGILAARSPDSNPLYLVIPDLKAIITQGVFDPDLHSSTGRSKPSKSPTHLRAMAPLSRTNVPLYSYKRLGMGPKDRSLGQFSSLSSSVQFSESSSMLTWPYYAGDWLGVIRSFTLCQRLRPASRREQLFNLLSPPHLSPLTSCKGVPETYSTSIGLLCEEETCQCNTMPYSSPTNDKGSFYA